MIEVTLRSVNEHKDLLSTRCKNCQHDWVFSREDFDPRGYNNCRLCGNLLPDIEALVFGIEYRITHHVRHAEHFVRGKNV